jgi:hypothetical protein
LTRIRERNPVGFQDELSSCQRQACSFSWETAMSTRTAILSVSALMAALLIAHAAQAVAPPGLFRAYLASTGSDTNDCTRPTPCRLLPVALAAVADGGEVWMLDSANYNIATVIITKSVSILAVPGAVGSVVATGGPAIIITFDNLKVSLRNLVIVPLPASGATDGVLMGVASTLFVENSLIANLPGNGIFVSGQAKLKVTNTVIRNNVNAAVYLKDGASGEISGSQMLTNYIGVFAQSTLTVVTVATVSDSVVSGATFGVAASAPNSGTARILITRSTIEGTDHALESTAMFGSTLVTTSGNMITNNNVAWNQSGPGSVIKSLGNNHIQDNYGLPIGTLTQASPSLY